MGVNVHAVYQLKCNNITVERVLIAWFNDCVLGVLGKSSQIAIPIITMVKPVPYYSMRTHIYVCESINCECRKYNSQLIDIRN